MVATARDLVADARRNALIITLIVGIITVILCAAALSRMEQGPIGFAVIGTAFSERDPDGTTGYDGQFFYFIARDGANSVPYLDGPTLRYQRALYPALSRLLMLGSVDLLPWVMVAINIVAQAVGAGLITYLVTLRGGPAWAGVIYGLWIGGQFGVRLDLSEPLCVALALGAVAAYCHQRWMLTAALLVLSTLTKEIGLVMAAALALHGLSERQFRRAVLMIAPSALAFLLWWGVLFAWFGTLPTRYPAAYGIRFVPFNGLFSETDTVEFIFLTLFLGIPALILLGSVWSHFRHRRPMTISAAVLIAGLGFVSFMPDVSWQDQLAAYRVATPLIVGGLLFAAEHAPRQLRLLAVLWLIPLLFVVVSPLWFGG